MINIENFKKKYEKLNSNQKMAVDSIEGPVMVIAGPGTGKTSILTLRIANILKETDTDPESILALTFTDSGVISMRKKLSEIIGPVAYQIKITTFHGFTNELIQNNPDIFQAFASFNSATDIDQLKIIEEILDDKKFSDLKPLGDPSKYVTDIKSLISELKKENISPTEYSQKIKIGLDSFLDDKENYNSRNGDLKALSKNKLKKFDKSFLVAEIFERYQEKLSNLKLYDFDDMILSVINVFKENPDFLLEQQERFLYILADEHQDANGSQNEILELLANFHENPNLFIVGDEKQAIFRFQGASLENFLYFKNKFPNTKIIELKDNYRSSQTILDSAFGLIDNNFLENRKKDNIFLKSGLEKNENKIEINEYPSENSENYLIAEKIKKLIDSGEDPNEIAVIYRKNRESFEIANFFEKFNIPFFIKSNQNILLQSDINKIIQFSEAVLDLTNNHNLAKVIAFDYLKNNPIDLHKIFNYLNTENILLIDLLDNEEILNKINIKNKENLLKLKENLINFSIVAKNNHAIDFFESLIYKTGLIKDMISSSSSLERLSVVERLFSELKSKSFNDPDYKISDFIEYLSLIKSYNLGITGNVSPIENGVNLMTAHGSKGLEFKTVFIPHTTNRIWDKNRNIEFFYFPNKNKTENLIEDQGRLFYVALTRAKENVFISYSKFDLDNKLNSATQFIYEIKEELKNINTIDDSNIKERYNLILNQKERVPNIHDKEYIKNLFLSKTLSVSALNNYKKCPWRYFYQNLLRLPKDQSDDQKNGDAVHYALRHFYHEFDDKQIKPNLEKFLGYYVDFLNKTNIELQKRERYIERGKKDLEIFYNDVPEKLDNKVLTEYTIGDIELELKSKDKLKIYGKIDRIDFMSSGEIMVIDYKTMEPKSANEIMGNTQNSSSDIYRQLIFYKFLIDSHYKNDWKMNTGRIIFMKSKKDDNKIKHLDFNISDEQVNDLKKEILEFADSVLNLDFWNKTCEEKDCEFCKLGRPN